ncbi:MAG: hypothetical protein ABH829_00330 [archaeon]
MKFPVSIWSQNKTSERLYFGITAVCLFLAASMWDTRWGVGAFLVWLGLTTKCYLMQIPELPHTIDIQTYTPYYIAFWFGPKWAIPIIFLNIYVARWIQLNNVDDGLKCLLRFIGWIVAVYAFVFLTHHYGNLVKLVAIAVVIEQSILYLPRLYLGVTMPIGYIKSIITVWVFYPLINTAVPMAAFAAYYLL